MADTITWVRPSGTEITTNGLPATIEHAAQMGWKPKGDDLSDPKPDATPKPGRAKKAG
jgi:hypothetical protein